MNKIIAAATATMGLLSGCGAAPAKLGWMDNQDHLTQAERQRIAFISGSDMGSMQGADGFFMGGGRGSITRRDFEILRQDRRRARAAYPDVSPDDLFQGVWLAVDVDARIPSDWCGSFNSQGTEVDGKWYLDGGCYESIVKPQYTKRASGEETAKYFVELKAKQRSDELARLEKDGPFTMWGGTGGSMSVSLDKKTNQVVVTRAQEWASKGVEYRIPFVPQEWVGVNYGDLDAIKKLPSFAHAISKEIPVTPSGVTITMGSALR